MCLIFVAFCRCCKKNETPSSDSDNISRPVQLEAYGSLALHSDVCHSDGSLPPSDVSHSDASLPPSDDSGPPRETGDEGWRTQYLTNYEQEPRASYRDWKQMVGKE